VLPLWSFQGARGRSAQQRNAGLEAGLSKLSSVVDVEVDVLLGEPSHPTAEAIEELGAPGVIAPDSLERR